MKEGPLTFCEGNAIRESYLIFPRWTQPFWTWLTGRALPGESPLIAFNHRTYLAFALITYFIGILLGIASVITELWILLPFAWILTVGSTRKLVSTVVHQCIHNRFGPDRRAISLIAEALTILTFTKSAVIYRVEHTHLHHRRGVFTTERDPSAKFLFQCGFVPGSSIKSSIRRLFLCIISLTFHLRFLASRINGNFVSVSARRRIVATLFWALTIACLMSFGNVQVVVGAFIAAYVAPVIFLYHVSVLFEFISEHAWLAQQPDFTSGASTLTAATSWGRFCGSPVPPPSGYTLINSCNWVGWLLTTLCYHLLVRAVILPGDLPQHDFHHRFPGTTAWTQAAYARTASAVQAPSEFVEFWGLHRAILHVFRGLEGVASAPTKGGPEKASLPLNINPSSRTRWEG